MAVTSISDKKFTDINAVFLEKLGYSRDEIIGKTSNELGFFADREGQESIRRLLLDRGQVKEIEE